MNARTIVEIGDEILPLKAGEGCVLLGSCFSGYMGERMEAAGIPTLFNPLGTLFNPISIVRVLFAATHPATVDSSVFYAQADKEWRSWLADTKVKAQTPQECAQLVQTRLETLKSSIATARYLFVTLGTNVCYRLVEDDSVVSNCHRQPDRMFRECRLSQTQCVEALLSIAEMAQNLNPDIHIVFTVSPFRYKKYTLHGSQLAKSILLLAIDEVCTQWPSVCHYFPAYEIVMDELRDYRYYAEDMLHPSPEAADYIWNILSRKLLQ